jgi:hypothetical protein
MKYDVACVSQTSYINTFGILPTFAEIFLKWIILGKGWNISVQN